MRRHWNRLWDYREGLQVLPQRLINAVWVLLALRDRVSMWITIGQAFLLGANIRLDVLQIDHLHVSSRLEQATEFFIFIQLLLGGLLICFSFIRR